MIRSYSEFTITLNMALSIMARMKRKEFPSPRIGKDIEIAERYDSIDEAFDSLEKRFLKQE